MLNLHLESVPGHTSLLVWYLYVCVCCMFIFWPDQSQGPVALIGLTPGVKPILMKKAQGGDRYLVLRGEGCGRAHKHAHMVRRGAWGCCWAEGSVPFMGALPRESPFSPILYLSRGFMWGFLWRKASILQQKLSNTRRFLRAHSIVLWG